ncbi:mechanosensitive ion channel family protein [Umezakia ovalisporum]|uniref:Mechanosensitive ion channel family protein n=1 Tax=Umezakia ovalisporum FSS-43 TaxID=2740520 RepID=A0ABT6K1C7_9CYAN|nr:mechanosensitive ion channel domain-containing protein [Umezakia ovalisporum]MDH6056180.1 mechanosensitive ion channel family protein [Umezakia ovalisporum FSS-43]MDH6065847.1 mechanosensitive ion channel family protein [Umezakia ovalisporum APH033B]MDH6072127.1 mechanosensitive ion channel family protein [Umezakia ovalisporum CobakiLakeA]MDH6074020.1 mechanosensitive ion channel family protein [Umezakia ovalisporum CS-1034]MDH6076929.1 mechanosensitive ion channel family protein [Umezakia 
MLDFALETITIKEITIALLGLVAVSLIFGIFRLIFVWLKFLRKQLKILQTKDIYQKLIQPNEILIISVFIVSALELISFLFPRNSWTTSLEIIISLTLTITTSLLASRLFKNFFDFYLLNIAFQTGQKISSELLILVKWIANIIIIFVAILIYAQSHQINLLGLLASLGIGGLAVAFAAQKTLEQVLGGIVIYLDRPFVIDDYIGLPDGTFGRVESIGLRSTRIRTSGKGTVVIVPNSSLTQVNIENFTGAKKVMSILYLTFYRAINSEEKALIRQVILESTSGIFGLDSRNTNVTFKNINNLVDPDKTQAQVSFFILGSGDVSMELRRQLLDLATQSMTQYLKEYGISFDIEEPTVYVDSPITI